MDNLLLPMENLFSSQIEVIGFAPTETIKFIHNQQRYMIHFFFSFIQIVNTILPFFHSIYSLVLVIGTGTIVSFVRAHDLNESHIHPSTCSSTLRASSKSGGFRDISDWLSCVSNKLFNSWHVESYAQHNGLVQIDPNRMIMNFFYMNILLFNILLFNILLFNKIIEY